MSISVARWSIQGRDRFPRLLFSRTADWQTKLWCLTGRVLTGVYLKGWLVELYSPTCHPDLRLSILFTPGRRRRTSVRGDAYTAGKASSKTMLSSMYASSNCFALSTCRRVSHACGFHGLSSWAWFHTPNSCCSDVRSGRRFYLRKGLDEDGVVIYVRMSHAFANLDPLSPMQAHSLSRKSCEATQERYLYRSILSVRS